MSYKYTFVTTDWSGCTEYATSRVDEIHLTFYRNPQHTGHRPTTVEEYTGKDSYKQNVPKCKAWDNDCFDLEYFYVRDKHRLREYWLCLYCLRARRLDLGGRGGVRVQKHLYIQKTKFVEKARCFQCRSETGTTFVVCRKRVCQECMQKSGFQDYEYKHFQVVVKK